MNERDLFFDIKDEVILIYFLKNIFCPLLMS